MVPPANRLQWVQRAGLRSAGSEANAAAGSVASGCDGSTGWDIGASSGAAAIDAVGAFAAADTFAAAESVAASGAVAEKSASPVAAIGPGTFAASSSAARDADAFAGPRARRSQRNDALPIDGGRGSCRGASRSDAASSVARAPSNGGRRTRRRGRHANDAPGSTLEIRRGIVVTGDLEYGRDVRPSISKISLKPRPTNNCACNYLR